MTKNITENINKTEIITKKIISLFIPICLLLISFSLVNCPDPGTDTSTPGNGNGNGNGGGQPDVPPQIIVEYRSAVTNKDATQSGFLLSLRDEPAGDVSVSMTISRSDGSGTATVNLNGSTATATETISFIFTQQNWNIPQEFLLKYGNSSPDQANVKIVFSVTSTADTAYNDLTYIVSGNLTHLGIPKFRIHVHNAQSPEPEDTDAKYTTETDCTTAEGAWDGTACTVDDDRNIKVWFSLEPSIDSLGQAAVCVAAGGLWSAPHCVITPENTCEKAYGAGTWDSVAATCGSTITAEAACTASGNAWDSGNSTCGFITAEAACTASGKNWDGTDTCVVTEEAACTASGKNWDSDDSTCVVTAEKACRALANTTGTWNSGTCVSPITGETVCTDAGNTWVDVGGTDTCVIPAEKACQATTINTWDSGNSICVIPAEKACLATTGNTWDGTDTCFITTEQACLATSGNAWNSGTSTCGSITAETACLATTGNAWNSDTSTCGSIAAETACLATTGTWDSTTDTCVSFITAEAACLATFENWDSTTDTCVYPSTSENACATTLHGTWDSADAKCVIMPEKACEASRGVFDSSNSICSISPKLACDTALHTWINKAEPVCAITNPQSHDSDITITYTVTAETASTGEDYTAPTTTPEETTVTIPALETSAYLEIPLLEDSVSNPSDVGDETFKVSITSVSTPGANLSTADTDATVTIGDPNESAFYFFPNRPLVNGDTPYWECYHLPEGVETFIDTAALVELFINNIISSTPQYKLSLNGNGSANGIDLSPYKAMFSDGIFDNIFLLFPSTGKTAMQFGFNTVGNFSYDSSRDIYNFACYGLKSGGNTSDSKTVGGPFGQLEFGQAYEYK